jgi:hypothetical protein
MQCDNVWLQGKTVMIWAFRELVGCGVAMNGQPWLILVHRVMNHGVPNIVEFLK